MRAFAKSILISILVSIAILLFTNFIFFFPWYMTLIVETFNVSQVVASENYLSDTYHDDALNRLEERPIYRDKAQAIKITAVHPKDNHSARGGSVSQYQDPPEEGNDEKPYRQRGEEVKVTIEAVYPLSIKLWGKTYEREIPVSFSLTTTGLKHYKDLQYYEYLNNWYEDP